MKNYLRTHNCGQLTKEHNKKNILLAGWVHRRRDHGGLIFIDLRDRFGITQLVFDPEVNKECHEIADTLRSEWVIAIEGQVVPRKEGMINPKLSTGEIEIEVSSISILSSATTPPFSISDDFLDVNEELRLKYRYLDIRRGIVANNLILRHRVMLHVRNFLDKSGFLEVNTPILCKSTPEGARDYLVPSRIYPGKFFALPQSPQMFKQLLMIAGMDRYFQIAPCFRDEDLRADRQPEFTQIDIEMSFDYPENLFALVEDMLANIFSSCLNITISKPFRRMSHAECIEKYGTDKPDLRFEMPLFDIGDIAAKSSFTVFTDQLQNGATIKGICIKGGADLSRKNIEEYTAFVGKFGVKGLAWMKMQDGALTSNIVKFFDAVCQKALIERFTMENGDLLFMVADTKARTNQSLDHLRRKLAKDRNLITPGQFEFLWVDQFPLFTWDEATMRYDSEHHPFTAVLEDDIPLLDTDPLKVRSESYDLVLNGYELASGSKRIHDQNLQKKIFQLLKFSEEDIQTKFGFFIESLRYGTPPHLGIALGCDRLIMILANTENIRDVIAFPKTQKATDLMMDCPSMVQSDQLDVLGIEISD